MGALFHYSLAEDTGLDGPLVPHPAALHDIFLVFWADPPEREAGNCEVLKSFYFLEKNGKMVLQSIFLIELMYILQEYALHISKDVQV